MPFRRPGTYVSEVNTLGTVLSDTPAAAITCFVEKTYSGPTTPTLVTNWNEFATLYGGFTDPSLYLPYAVWQFFANGGAQCYVTRVVGSGGVSATATLKDRAATPQNTLSITAVSPGIWGNNIRVSVVDRGTTRFDLIVYNGAAVDANRVETFLDLAMEVNDPRYVVNVINSLTSGSQYIIAADLNSLTAAPNDRPGIATTVLLTGNDGSAPVTLDYTTAINTLDVLVAQAMVVNLPGNSANAVIAAAISYCENRGDAFLVVDTSQNLVVAAAVAEAAAYSQSSYAAVYYPWLQTVDPGSSVAGATRNLPPGGAVCGIIARTDLQSGPFRAPAGLGAKISGVVALERKLTQSDLDSLNDSYIDAVRNHPVGGIVVFGARTLSRTAATRYVPVRRSLIYVKDNCRRLSDFAVFEPNDPGTWSTVQTRLAAFLTAYWQAGGLQGVSSEQAFYVVCDGTNNTPNTIAAGEMHIEVGVAVISPAEFIVINIGQYDGGATAVEA